jgi:hypothetical protein
MTPLAVFIAGLLAVIGLQSLGLIASSGEADVAFLLLVVAVALGVAAISAMRRAA